MISIIERTTAKEIRIGRLVIWIRHRRYWRSCGIMAAWWNR